MLVPGLKDIHIVRKSLLERAKDPAFSVKQEINRKLFKLGIKDDVWPDDTGGVWFTLYYKRKPVAMARALFKRLALEPGASPVVSPSIEYVVDRKERGKGYGEVAAIHTAIWALEEGGRYHMIALVDNVPSVRTIIASTAAVKALYGARLKVKSTFVRTQAERYYGLKVPALLVVVRLD